MIVNTKKLYKPKGDTTKAAMINQEWSNKLIQIFVNHVLTHEAVKSNPNEFAKFIEAKAPIILSTFEKTITGKNE